MQTKNALANLKNRYLAVLKKCNLLNVFGSLAMVGMLTVGAGVALAAPGTQATNPSGTSVDYMSAVDLGNTLINNGSVSGGGDFVYHPSLYDMRAGVFGYDNVNDQSYTLTNSGDITINAAEVGMRTAGLFAYTEGDGHQSLTNVVGGEILVFSFDSFAFGMYARGDGSSTINNAGSVHARTADETVYGAFAQSEVNGDVTFTNSGTFTVLGEGVYYATGAYLEVTGEGNAFATNDNTMTVSGANVVTRGIYADIKGGGTSTVMNNGTVSSTSVNKNAIGLQSYTISGTNTITNAANASVSAESTDGSVYGILGRTETGQNIITNNASVVADSQLTYADSIRSSVTADGSNRVENYGSLTATSDSGVASSINVSIHGAGNNTIVHAANAEIIATAKLDAYGIVAGTNDGDNTVNSNGTITVTALESYTIGISVGANGNNNITNTAAISAKNTAGTAIGISADAKLGGHNDITNNSTIKAETTDGVAYGVDVSATDSGNNTINNSVAITATSTNLNAYGINAEAAGGNNDITNDGSITATGSTDATYGISAVSTAGNNVVANNGTITASSANADVNSTNGIYTRTTDGSNSVTNDANAVISVTANGTAYGVRTAITGTGNTTFVNNGDITVASFKDSAFGVYVTPGSDSTNTFTNTGTIAVTGTRQAAGILLNLAGGTSSARVENSGSITATTTMAKSQAYEVVGLMDYSVGNYATVLRTWTGDDAVFATSLGNVITFDNTVLTVRPGTAEQGFVSGDVYSIANMVAIDNVQQTEFATGTIEGTIAGVATEADFLKAELIDAGTSQPKVSLTVQSESLPNGTVSEQNITTAISQMENISKGLRTSLIRQYSDALLVDAGTSVNAGSMQDERKWTFFVTPYGSHTENDKYNFDADSYGVTGGLTYKFTPEFSAGFHLDFNATESEGNGLDVDATTVALGAHADYFINKQWYVGGHATFSLGTNDADYRIAFDRASDEYDSRAFYARAKTGYIFELNKNNIIVPEIGLSYLYADTDSYDLAFSSLSQYNMMGDSNSFNNFYVDAMVSWQGNFEVGQSSITPSLGLGVRQALTDSDVDTSVTVFDTRYDSTVSSDETTMLATAGLEWTKEGFTLGAYYDGKYGSDQTEHMGSLKFIFEF